MRTVKRKERGKDVTGLSPSRAAGVHDQSDLRMLIPCFPPTCKPPADTLRSATGIAQDAVLPPRRRIP